MKGDIDAMADQVFQAVKAFISLQIGKVGGRVDLIEQTVKSIPAPLKGDPGEKGLPGDSIKGDRGEKGERGDKGEPGESIKGEPGESIRGEKGEPGESIKGDKGDRGVDGATAYELAKTLGFEGSQKEWLESLLGSDGVDGKDGASIKGDPGEPGKSTFDIALARGFDGTEKQWLTSLHGDKGEVGPVGKDGADGLSGKDGVNGLNGKDGADGINGKDGADGLAGKDGANAFEIAKGHGFSGSELDWLQSLVGKQGPRGENGREAREVMDGRDAMELEVLDGIDETRSYPRSTYASFNGGTFRAARATDPLKGKSAIDAGWQCIVRGVSSETEEWEDSGRFITRTITYSDGTMHESRKQTAIPIYRGVHQKGKLYLRGDAVTSDGSQWIAKVDNNESPRGRPPGEEQVWQLSVKAEVRNPR